MIKLIILDLYGVVTRGSYKETCQWLAKKYGGDWHAYYEILYHKYFDQAALGKITEREFFTGALKDFAVPLPWKVVRDKHLSLQTPNKAVVNFGVKLQRRGFSVLVLSKNIPSHMRYLVRKYKLRNFFPHIINTYDLGLPKASPKTMKYILGKFSVKPSEVIMTDDQDFNLVAPKKMGVKTVLFKNTKQFVREVKELLEK